MGFFSKNTNGDAEAMARVVKELAPSLEVGIAIKDGQACVSLPAPYAMFCYLIPRKGLWTLFEALSDESTWAWGQDPSIFVVGRLKDNPYEVARLALEWHAKPSSEKRWGSPHA